MSPITRSIVFHIVDDEKSLRNTIPLTLQNALQREDDPRYKGAPFSVCRFKSGNALAIGQAMDKEGKPIA